MKLYHWVIWFTFWILQLFGLPVSGKPIIPFNWSQFVKNGKQKNKGGSTRERSPGTQVPAFREAQTDKLAKVHHSGSSRQVHRQAQSTFNKFHSTPLWITERKVGVWAVLPGDREKHRAWPFESKFRQWGLPVKKGSMPFVGLFQCDGAIDSLNKFQPEWFQLLLSSNEQISNWFDSQKCPKRFKGPLEKSKNPRSAQNGSSQQCNAALECIRKIIESIEKIKVGTLRFMKRFHKEPNATWAFLDLLKERRTTSIKSKEALMEYQVLQADLRKAKEKSDIFSQKQGSLHLEPPNFNSKDSKQPKDNHKFHLLSFWTKLVVHYSFQKHWNLSPIWYFFCNLGKTQGTDQQRTGELDSFPWEIQQIVLFDFGSLAPRLWVCFPEETPSKGNLSKRQLFHANSDSFEIQAKIQTPFETAHWKRSPDDQQSPGFSAQHTQQLPKTDSASDEKLRNLGHLEQETR